MWTEAMNGSNLLFKDVASQIRRRIARGELPVGSSLPSIDKLRVEFDVSRNTIVSALRTLQEDGLIGRTGSRRHGFSVVKEPEILEEGERAARTIEMQLPFNYWHYVGSRVLETMEHAVRETGLRLIFGNNKNAEETERQLLEHAVRTLRPTDNAALVVMTATSYNNPNVDLLNQLAHSIPVVLLDRRIEGFSAPFVGVDNVGVGMDATRGLLERGHTRIGFVTTVERLSTGKERHYGYDIAIREAGLETSRDWLIGLPHSFAAPTEVDQLETELERSLSGLASPPTGWVCSSDKDAIALVAALERTGRKVPRDAEVIGCDHDQYLCNRHGCRLATYAYPYEAICAEVVAMIQNGRRETESRPHRNVLFAAEFVPGQTLT
jgi:GntR family transcriptional regulator of arabinose operon